MARKPTRGSKDNESSHGGDDAAGDREEQPRQQVEGDDGGANAATTTTAPAAAPAVTSSHDLSVHSGSSKHSGSAKPRRRSPSPYRGRAAVDSRPAFQEERCAPSSAASSGGTGASTSSKNGLFDQLGMAFQQLNASHLAVVVLLVALCYSGYSNNDFSSRLTRAEMDIARLQQLIKSQAPCNDSTRVAHHPQPPHVSFPPSPPPPPAPLAMSLVLTGASRGNYWKGVSDALKGALEAGFAASPRTIAANIVVAAPDQVETMLDHGAFLLVVSQIDPQRSSLPTSLEKSLQETVAAKSGHLLSICTNVNSQTTAPNIADPLCSSRLYFHQRVRSGAFEYTINSDWELYDHELSSLVQTLVTRAEAAAAA